MDLSHELAMQMPELDLGLAGWSREGAAARAMGIPSSLNPYLHSDPQAAATSAQQAIRLTQCDAWWRGWDQEDVRRLDATSKSVEKRDMLRSLTAQEPYVRDRLASSRRS